MKKYKVITDNLDWLNIKNGNTLIFTEDSFYIEENKYSLQDLLYDWIRNCIILHNNWFEEVKEEEVDLIKLIYPVSIGMCPHVFVFNEKLKNTDFQIQIPCAYLEKYIHKDLWVDIIMGIGHEYTSEEFLLTCEIPKGIFLKIRYNDKPVIKFTKKDMILYASFCVNNCGTTHMRMKNTFEEWLKSNETNRDKE